MLDRARARTGGILDARDLDPIARLKLRKRTDKGGITPQTEARIERRRGFKNEHLSAVCSDDALFEVSTLETFAEFERPKLETVGRDGNTLGSIVR